MPTPEVEAAEMCEGSIRSPDSSHPRLRDRARQVLDIGRSISEPRRARPALLDEHEHEHDDDIGCVAIRERGAVDATQFNRWLNELVQPTAATSCA